MRPALQIATHVLLSNPAHWWALLNFTQSLRKVPLDVDGRTTEEKSSEDYRQYRSLWLPTTETSWEEYDAAQRLNDLNFESGMATYALLKRGEVIDEVLCLLGSDKYRSG